MKRFLSVQSLGLSPSGISYPFDPAEKQRQAYRAIMGHDPPANFAKGTEAYRQWVNPAKWLREHNGDA